MIANIKSIFKSDEAYPVLCHYTNEHYPQPAYLELDLKNGEVDAVYNGEIGSVPCNVHHYTLIWLPISCYMTAKQIDDLIAHFEPQLVEIYSNSDIVWDGNNHIGSASDSSSLTHEQWYELVSGLRQSLYLYVGEMEGHGEIKEPTS